MLLFRSEEHAGRWTQARGEALGAFMSPAQQWELARTWYHRRLEPDWRRFSTQEAHRIFEHIGLVGPFWDLAG
jgi:Alkylmercury lyase